MATRGYFTIINPEAGDEDPYYGHRDDLFIEAYHDGYPIDMLLDVLNIPQGLVKATMAGLGNVLWNLNEKVALFHHRPTPGGNMWDDLVWKARAMGSPFEMTWIATYELLLLTCSGKYSHIAPGVTRYHHPITTDDSCFFVETEQGRPDMTTITISDANERWLWEDDDEEPETLLEYIRGYMEQWAATRPYLDIDSTPQVIEEDGKVKIVLSYAKMFLREYYVNHLSKVDFSTVED